MSMHFATVWEAIARAIPDATALVHGHQRRSWQSFEDRAARIATALTSAGLGPNAKVAIYFHNGNEYLEAQFGTFKARCCPVNVNYRYLEDELLYLLDNCDAEALFFPACYADRIHSIVGRLPRLKLLIQLDDGSGELQPEALGFENLIASHEPQLPMDRPEDDLYMLYTGGTTGLPKGVMYHNGSMCRALMQGHSQRGLPAPLHPEEVVKNVQACIEQDLVPRSLVACPLMHGTGMWIGAMMALNLGGTVITLPNFSFDADLLWEVVEAEQASSITIVGDAFAKPMLKALQTARTRGQPYDISSVDTIISSGVMWTEEVKAALLEFGHLTLIDAMGSSEGAMGSTTTTRESPRRTATFKLDANNRVFNDRDQEIKPGSDEIGMIAASGNVPLGYYKDPDKSARTFRTINGVRYSFPGDFATVLPDGTINLLGRGSLCINSAGEKVFPEEVEEVLKRHEAIDDCLVVGLPDEKYGERVVAIVSVEADLQADEQGLARWCRSRLAGYKVPKQIAFVDAVQRAPNGKADYQWAKQIAANQLAPTMPA